MLVDKPAGPTSHDAVRRVRLALGVRAAGHTGTLDPFATGLLVVLVGRATRLARFVERVPKTYLATARLGLATDTDDLTGAPLGPALSADVPEPRLLEALAGFVGVQRQRPPAYSAKRVAGERSYRLARRGEAPALAAAAVVVYAVSLVAYAPPDVTFRATVGPGTYLRAIARDLGERLGVGAHLAALRREAIGPLRVEDATPLAAVSPTDLLPARRVLGHLPAVELDEAGRAAVAHGRPVPGGNRADAVVLTYGGEVVAVAGGDGERLRPLVVLADAP